MSVFKKISVFVFASIIAAAPASAAGPDKKNRVSGESVAKLYAGKTWIWSKGGSHWGADGSFQAVWNDSVGLGKWYATSKGNLCYEAKWYWEESGATKSEDYKRCWRHVSDSEGQLWKLGPDDDDEWYRPKKEFAERIKPGNTISRQIKKLRRKLGV